VLALVRRGVDRDGDTPRSTWRLPDPDLLEGSVKVALTFVGRGVLWWFLRFVFL
jgi:hypothetical protein